MRTMILTVTVGLCFSVALVQPSRAQVISYSSADVEELRTQLLGLADTVQQFAALAPSDLVDLDSLENAKAQIQEMPYAQLNTLRQGISPSKIGSRLARARQEIAAYSEKTAETKRKFGKELSDSTSFPVVSGTCTNSSGNNGPGRIPVSVILAADVTWFIADSTREQAQDACKQDVLGENTSLACVIVDTVWITAKSVNEGIHFCDDYITGNVGDANFARLDDVHTDLFSVGTSLDTHLTSANTDVDSKIASLDTHLTNVDTHIANEFAALASSLTTIVANLSAQLTAATNQLAAGEDQIMKLDLTPDGLRQIVGSILTCDGTSAKPCPSVLNLCPSGKCSWNNVGPLP